MATHGGRERPGGRSGRELGGVGPLDDIRKTPQCPIFFAVPVPVPVPVPPLFETLFLLIDATSDFTEASWVPLFAFRVSSEVTGTSSASRNFIFAVTLS